MASTSPEARSLLKTVELDGVAVVQSRRILWALGWSQDRQGAWKDLLDLWCEMGQPPETLYAIAVSDKLVFLKKALIHTPLVLVQEWAGIQSTQQPPAESRWVEGTD